MTSEPIKINISKGESVTGFAFLIACAVIFTEMLFGNVPDLIWQFSSVYASIIAVVVIVGNLWKLMQ